MRLDPQMPEMCTYHEILEFQRSDIGDYYLHSSFHHLTPIWKIMEGAIFGTAEYTSHLQRIQVSRSINMITFIPTFPCHKWYIYKDHSSNSSHIGEADTDAALAIS